MLTIEVRPDGFIRHDSKKCRLNFEKIPLMKMRRLWSAFAAPVALITLMSGCASQVSAVETITDVEPVSISATESASVARVIALANGSAEIVAALGYKNILIGRDIASTSSELSSVEVVTSGHQVLPEKILSLDPDLVLIDASTGPASALKVLRESGVRLVTISEAWSTTDISKKIVEVAAAIGMPSAGNDLNAAMESFTQNIPAVPSEASAVFLYLRGGSAIYLVGGKGSGADSLLDAIGVKDLGAQNLENPFTPMSTETLSSLNPDIFLVMSKGLESVGGLQGFLELPGVAQTNAGRNRAVVAVDDSLLLSFGPRTPALIESLAQSINTVLSR
jgi:iron complex transport system substrate-binding protein